MQIHYCRNKCCKIKIKEYHKTPTIFNKNALKGGVFIYDPINKKALIVQSRGRLWGPPKGTLKDNESGIECAIREVKEETGLDICGNKLYYNIVIHNRAIYYYYELDSLLEYNKIDIQQNAEEDANDANGITWIKINCLYNAIEDGNITLNHHARLLFYKFIHQKFPKNNWIKVNRKKR